MNPFDILLDEYGEMSEELWAATVGRLSVPAHLIGDNLMTAPREDDIRPILLPKGMETIASPSTLVRIHDEVFVDAARVVSVEALGHDLGECHPLLETLPHVKVVWQEHAEQCAAFVIACNDMAAARQLANEIQQRVNRGRMTMGVDPASGADRSVVQVVNTRTAPTVYTQPDQCCFIDPAGLQCQQKATHWIGTDGIDNYTHSCAAHINDLQSEGDAVRPLRSADPWHLGFRFSVAERFIDDCCKLSKASRAQADETTRPGDDRDIEALPELPMKRVRIYRYHKSEENARPELPFCEVERREKHEYVEVKMESPTFDEVRPGELIPTYVLIEFPGNRRDWLRRTQLDLYAGVRAEIRDVAKMLFDAGVKPDEPITGLACTCPAADMLKDGWRCTCGASK